jgi:hypothetical protein
MSDFLTYEVRFGRSIYDVRGHPPLAIDTTTVAVPNVKNARGMAKYAAAVQLYGRHHAIFKCWYRFLGARRVG